MRRRSSAGRADDARRPSALRRVSLVRLALLAALVGLIALAATPTAGPLRAAARGLVVVIGLAIVVSYLVEFALSRRRR